MGRMKELRAALAVDLSVLNIPIMDDWSVRADPPCVFLTPPQANDYVVAGKEYGTCFVMNLDVVILVELRPPNEGRDELENLLEDVLRNTVDWSLTGVDPPGTVSKGTSTHEFMAATVHLSKGFYL
jgi:hypothetical protein